MRTEENWSRSNSPPPPVGALTQSRVVATSSGITSVAIGTDDEPAGVETGGSVGGAPGPVSDGGASLPADGSSRGGRGSVTCDPSAVGSIVAGSTVVTAVPVVDVAGVGDTLLGGGGRDRLNGGTGRDRLYGGPGRDRCDGRRC